MSGIKLEPCPFCGGPALIWKSRGLDFACCEVTGCPGREPVCSVERWNHRAVSEHVEPAPEVAAPPVTVSLQSLETLLDIRQQFGPSQDGAVERDIWVLVNTPRYAVLRNIIARWTAPIVPSPAIDPEVHRKVVEALREARVSILELKNTRWSEAEGSNADWTAEIDAALALVGEAG